MSENIIADFANQIHMIITHPEQVIAGNFALQVLESGSVGFFAAEDKFNRKYLIN